MSDPVVVLLTSSGSWQCPAAITSIKVECWGPGGRGQSVNETQGTGGGGGSYARRDAVTVVPGQTYTYTVGAGSSETDTLFTAGSVTVRGRAGANGASGAPGAGGAAVSADGDTYFSGGDGGATESYGGQYYSGGGGGGAGTTEAGGNASGRLAGDGGSADGGNGGAGRYTNGNGAAGSSYGGGGAGASNLAGNSTGGAGATGAIRITYTLPPPGTPVITEPANGLAIAPGATIDLSARADDPAELDVKYRWKYSKDGGADQTIGDSSVVASGTEATYTWDTSALTAGTYVLKCWAVNTNDDASVGYAEVTIHLAYVLITAPADESSHVSGELSLTGEGYLTGEGKLRVQWEIDSVNPPDPESADYDLITSALVDQDTSVSVAGNVSHLGTWYVRARTMDTAEEPNYSDWTDIRTIYVLERLRLLPGSQVKRSLGKWANRVYCVVEQSSPLIVAVATNTTVSPTYAESPREIAITAPPGTDLDGAQEIANAHLALRMDPSTQLKLSGLRVRLVDGMKLARGQRVGIAIERDGIDATLPIIELTFDVAAAICEVTVGNWWEPRTMSDHLLAIAQKVQQLEKEAATA